VFSSLGRITHAMPAATHCPLAATVAGAYGPAQTLDCMHRTRKTHTSQAIGPFGHLPDQFTLRRNRMLSESHGGPGKMCKTDRHPQNRSDSNILMRTRSASIKK
jgi:hypothetical protein